MGEQVARARKSLACLLLQVMLMRTDRSQNARMLKEGRLALMVLFGCMFLHVAVAAMAHMLPVMQTVRDHRDYVVRRGRGLWRDMIPLGGPVAVILGASYTVTVTKGGVVDSFEMFDCLDDVYDRYPFLK